MKKTIIIGAGNVGKNALDFLGADFVECFADNKKNGMTAFGKRVISVEEAVGLQRDYILLLAVTDYQEELKQQLLSLGAEKYYYFGEAVYFFDGIKQWDKRKRYEKSSLREIQGRYGLDKAVIIGRRNAYADFISELLGIAVDEEVCAYSGDEKYLLNMEAEDAENFLHKWNVEDKKNIFILPQLQHKEMQRTHERLREFKDKYAGKRCFIIGNGPSLRMEDLNKLQENGEICFGLNVIHKAYGNTKWRPTFVCMNDPLVIAQNYEAVRENNSCPLFVSDIKLFYYWDTQENEYLLHDMLEKVSFSDDITVGCSSGATVSYTAMQIGAYMGFQEIYLLGMDCSNWGQHFNSDYRMEKEAFRGPDEMKIFKAYQMAETYSRIHGFRILNATRGGCLEVFERVNFDSLFGKGTEHESGGICTDKA